MRCVVRVGPMAATLSPAAGAPTVGALLRDWRQRRRLSQLDLAIEADGVGPPPELRRDGPVEAEPRAGAAPGRAPGGARCATATPCCWRPATPRLPARRRSTPRRWRPCARPSTRSWRGHEPFPAVVVDRRWDLVAANRGASTVLTDGVAAGTCSSRRSTRCGSASTPTAWRPGSSTWPSTAPTCSTGCAGEIACHRRRRSGRAATTSCAAYPGVGRARRRRADAAPRCSCRCVLRDRRRAC